MQNVDYAGARGSNAGDQFHELWALLQILELLNAGGDLQAVGVEGVRAESSLATDGPAWDGVDVALYFGATSLEQADRVHFVQLKYSAANPDKDWTVSRLTENAAKKGNNSVIRRLAAVFKNAKVRMKAGAQFDISLVSNQGVSKRLQAALQTRWNGPLEQAGLPVPVVDDLEALRAASGLTAAEFSEFVAAMDFSETGGNSRFALKEKVVGILIDYLGDDVSSEARDLQIRVREQMLPERAQEVVTERDLLLWFGVSGRDGLFPSKPDIRVLPNAIRRNVAGDLIARLAKGERLILLHGVGGCGKTTVMQQIVKELPTGSLSIIFDCYGGGRYIYADDKRHLPENAFLQLTNEVALALRLPLFVPRSHKYPANVRSFLFKLKTAGQALDQIEPGALLVVIIDAADNSMHAAAAASPPERSFVLDLVRANLDELPKNVRFMFSSRSGRRDSLQLPMGVGEIECPLFDLAETSEHLATTFADLPDAVVEQFHALSQYNPRVQNYAIVASGGNPAILLDALRPGGKSLSDVLRTTFSSALQKLGQSTIFDRLLAALAFLPAPANVAAIARIAGTTEHIVRDWGFDLAPGLNVHDGYVSIADEDFELFIRETAAKDRDATISRIAADFLATFAQDAYSALHVADMLVMAGRSDQLLSVIEGDPQVNAIGDPVLRRQVQVRRLRLSTAACRGASATDALKTILISAEAEKDDSTLSELLERELDLSVEFGGASLRRAILLDPERVEDQGPFLARDAARASRVGDYITVREHLHFFRAWLRRRQDEKRKQDIHHWNIGDGDIAALIEANLYLGGPQAAFSDLMCWRPREVSIRVAYILVPQLISAGKADSLRALLDERIVPQPWDLIIWTKLAMAGESIDTAEIKRSLNRLRRRFIPDPSRFATSYGEDGWEKLLLNTWVVSCELGFRLGIDKTTLIATLTKILDVVEGEERKLYSFDFQRIDALFRCWCLRTALSGQKVGVDKFLIYLKSIEPTPPVETDATEKVKPVSRAARTEDRDQRRMNTLIRALFPVYAGRVAVLAASRADAAITGDLLEPLGSIGHHSYEFDRDYERAQSRAVAARAVMELLIVPTLRAGDIEVVARSLMPGHFADWVITHRLRAWEIMRLRRPEAVKLVKMVSEAAKEVREISATGSEKLGSMVLLARFVLPISRSDSEALFNDAVGIAKEIDREAVDQIEFMSVAAQYADVNDGTERRRIAANTFSFVTAASERLSSRDFNWHAGTVALTALDLPCALAAASRWSDDGTVDLSTTLGALLPTALGRKLVDSSLGASLSLLIDDCEVSLFKELATRAAAESGAVRAAVLEEVAKDALLLTTQQTRRQCGSAVLETTSIQSKGPWISRLRDAMTFIETEVATKSAPIKSRSDQGADLNKGGENRIKRFEFEPVGPVRTAADIETVLKEAADSGLSHSEADILAKMRHSSSDVNDRIPFLNAVAAVSGDVVWSYTKADAIYEAVMAWKGTPAIDHWCRDTLRKVLVDQFHGFCCWIKEGQAHLPKLLPLTGLDAAGQRNVILAGVAACGASLGSRTLFGVAELVCARLDTRELGPVLSWYSDRLLNRVSAADRVELQLSDVPHQPEEACGRLGSELINSCIPRLIEKARNGLPESRFWIRL